MLLLDCNAICYQQKFGMVNLSWEEKEVGIIFGFFRQLLSLSKTFESNEFVFVWDSRKSIRTEMFPDYKKARKIKKTPDEKRLDDIAYQQFNVIRDNLIPQMGFTNNFIKEGFEADDIIAKIVFSSPKEKEIVIVSADEDLYQLLSENVTMYSIKKKQEYTAKNLWDDYKITPSEWGEVKAIAGCKSDCVPGVIGVGEPTAAKFITRKLPKTHKTYKSIILFQELIERNRPLVVLPLKGTPEIPLRKDKLDYEGFVQICQRYGFKSFLTKDSLKQWKENIFHEG